MSLISRLIIIFAIGVIALQSYFVTLLAMFGTLLAEKLNWLAMWLLLLPLAWFGLTPFLLGAYFYFLFEALTLRGCEFSPFSHHRFHLLGGKFEKGGKLEYGIVVLSIILCMLITIKQETSSFLPFMYDWQKLYNEGIIDGYEWRENRFKFF